MITVQQFQINHFYQKGSSQKNALLLYFDNHSILIKVQPQFQIKSTINIIVLQDHSQEGLQGWRNQSIQLINQSKEKQKNNIKQIRNKGQNIKNREKFDFIVYPFQQNGFAVGTQNQQKIFTKVYNYSYFLMKHFKKKECQFILHRIQQCLLIFQQLKLMRKISEERLKILNDLDRLDRLISFLIIRNLIYSSNILQNIKSKILQMIDQKNFASYSSQLYFQKLERYLIDLESEIKFSNHIKSGQKKYKIIKCLELNKQLESFYNHANVKFLFDFTVKIFDNLIFLFNDFFIPKKQSLQKTIECGVQTLTGNTILEKSRRLIGRFGGIILNTQYCHHCKIQNQKENNQNLQYQRYKLELQEQIKYQRQFKMLTNQQERQNICSSGVQFKIKEIIQTMNISFDEIEIFLQNYIKKEKNYFENNKWIANSVKKLINKYVEKAFDIVRNKTQNCLDLQNKQDKRKLNSAILSLTISNIYKQNYPKIVQKKQKIKQKILTHSTETQTSQINYNKTIQSSKIIRKKLKLTKSVSVIVQPNIQEDKVAFTNCEENGVRIEYTELKKLNKKYKQLLDINESYKIKLQLYQEKFKKFEETNNYIQEYTTKFKDQQVKNMNIQQEELQRIFYCLDHIIDRLNSELNSLKYNQDDIKINKQKYKRISKKRNNIVDKDKDKDKSKDQIIKQNRRISQISLKTNTNLNYRRQSQFNKIEKSRTSNVNLNSQIKRSLDPQKSNFNRSITKISQKKLEQKIIKSNPVSSSIIKFQTNKKQVKLQKISKRQKLQQIQNKNKVNQSVEQNMIQSNTNENEQKIIKKKQKKSQKMNENQSLYHYIMKIMNKLNPEGAKPKQQSHQIRQQLKNSQQNSNRKQQHHQVDTILFKNIAYQNKPLGIFNFNQDFHNKQNIVQEIQVRKNKLMSNQSQNLLKIKNKFQKYKSNNEIEIIREGIRKMLKNQSEKHINCKKQYQGLCIHLKKYNQFLKNISEEKSQKLLYNIKIKDFNKIQQLKM